MFNAAIAALAQQANAIITQSRNAHQTTKAASSCTSQERLCVMPSTV
jgi:hypothetical protein